MRISTLFLDVLDQSPFLICFTSKLAAGRLKIDPIFIIILFYIYNMQGHNEADPFFLVMYL